VNKVKDGDRATFWNTEHYTGGNLPKQGVGLYVSTGSAVSARQLDVYSSTPGWTAKIYASNTAPPDIGGWGQPIGSVNVTQEKQTVSLDTAGRSFRNYLVWITKVPPGSGVANINELKLRR
jgi:serine/threonine-protein kinase